MRSRTELQTLLESLMDNKNVYFQPPDKLTINYPAIVYSLNNIKSEHADDRVYFFSKKYSVVLIDKNPDSGFVNKLVQLPLCSFDRHYKKDNLNHWTFSLYY